MFFAKEFINDTGFFGLRDWETQEHLLLVTASWWMDSSMFVKSKSRGEREERSKLWKPDSLSVTLLS